MSWPGNCLPRRFQVDPTGHHTSVCAFVDKINEFVVSCDNDAEIRVDGASEEAFLRSLRFLARSEVDIHPEREEHSTYRDRGEPHAW